MLWWLVAEDTSLVVTDTPSGTNQKLRPCCCKAEEEHGSMWWWESLVRCNSATCKCQSVGVDVAGCPLLWFGWLRLCRCVSMVLLLLSGGWAIVVVLVVMVAKCSQGRAWLVVAVVGRCLVGVWLMVEATSPLVVLPQLSGRRPNSRLVPILYIPDPSADAPVHNWLCSFRRLVSLNCRDSGVLIWLGSIKGCRSF